MCILYVGKLDITGGSEYNICIYYGNKTEFWTLIREAAEKR